MSRYEPGKKYKGLVNVSPQTYANNIFTLKPGQRVVVEAEIADKVHENARPSLDFVDPAEVDAIVAAGQPECREEYFQTVVNDLETVQEGGTQSPPANPSSTGQGESGAESEEGTTVRPYALAWKAGEAASAPKFVLEWKAPEPSQDAGSQETSTQEASTSSESRPTPTTSKAKTKAKETPDEEGDKPKRPRTNKDK